MYRLPQLAKCWWIILSRCYSSVFVIIKRVLEAAEFDSQRYWARTGPYTTNQFLSVNYTSLSPEAIGHPGDDPGEVHRLLVWHSRFANFRYAGE